jgi:hypothetical protein
MKKVVTLIVVIRVATFFIDYLLFILLMNYYLSFINNLLIEFIIY